MLAAAVHTTGVNVGSVALIITGIVVPTCTFIGWAMGRLERGRRRSQQRTEKFVRAQVDNVARMFALRMDMQTGRLEQMSAHLADQDTGQRLTIAQLSDVRERLARVEGGMGGRHRA